MTLLKELTQSIEGLKLQAGVALDGLENKELKVDKTKLSDAQKLISSNILKSNIVKLFMKENNIVSYPEIDIKAFELFYEQLPKENYFRYTVLSSTLDNPIVHFTDGVFNNLGKLENSYEVSNYGLCGEKIKGFSNNILTSEIENSNERIKAFGMSNDNTEELCLECARHLGFES